MLLLSLLHQWACLARAVVIVAHICVRLIITFLVTCGVPSATTKASQRG